jgi:hypothetical protein
MSGYWLRVENGFLYVVKGSDMGGDVPKWLAVLVVRSSEMVSYELRMATCT